MIQRIELWDFESHEHTVLDDISPALNLICGESNSGKTSIVRALKLVAYNQFDPRSVRVGATKCVVQVDTERGRVKVTRGPKHNAWEVTKTGRPTQYFDKVGVNIVPDAAEVIGLNIVTLGDVQVPVNIMDQLESHFMLAGVGDKDATGSMRAQIVDEISGLSGIEGIIKSVSLDHHRFGREIKELEDQMNQVQSQLHPEGELDKEAGVLADAERELKDHADMLSLIAEVEGLDGKASVAARQIEDVSHRLAAIPNAELALQEVSRADDSLERAVLAETLSRNGIVSRDRLSLVSKRLAEIPDTRRALGFIAKAEDASSKANAVIVAHARWETLTLNLERNKSRLELVGKALAASKFVAEAESSTSKANAATITHDRWRVLAAGLEKNRDRLEWIGKALAASGELTVSQEALDRCVLIQKLLSDSAQKASGITSLRQKIDDNGRRLKAAEVERDTILASVKTCPLTLKPVSKECMEGAAA
jgi:DNA repair exonuclease SbcCD ATPase subunit